MKRTIHSILALLLAIVCIASLASCNTADETDLWANATYRQDTEFGSGAKTVVVEVTAKEQKVTFTIKTDKTMVGEALMEHGLITGEQGAYGLYVKQVNGMTADYDVDQTYWAFYVNGEYGGTGVDMTEINEADTYQLELTKG